MSELDQELDGGRIEQAREVSERAAFYLTHRTLIETWALLRREAAEAVQSALLDLAGPLAEDLRSLGVDPVVTVHDGRSAGVRLARAEWRSDGATSPLTVGLAWDKSPIGAGGKFQVYTAVTAHGEGTSALGQADLGAMSDRVRGALGPGWRRDLPRWPVWSYVDAGSDAWTVDGLAERARSAVVELWTTAAPEVDRVLNAPPAHS